MTGNRNIAIVGSGNVAGFLAVQFYSKQFNVRQIISSNAVTGQKLAESVKADFSQEYTLHKDIDIAILCVPDSRIADCASMLADVDTNTIICHCAGSIGIDVLNRFQRYGILYPLQSVSENLNNSGLEVPFLIEASSTDVLDSLKTVVNELGYNYTITNSEERLHYHLAAVFANNFTNAMVLATMELTEKYQLEFALLEPLLSRTFEKLEERTPDKTQTGPAKRKDFVTIDKHLELLKSDEKLVDVYKAISHYITSKFNH